MVENKNAPSKPPRVLWVFALLLIFGGLLWLHDFLEYGYIRVSKLSAGEHYTGSLAVLVIIVSLCVGFILLGYAIRRWWLCRKSSQHGATL